MPTLVFDPVVPERWLVAAWFSLAAAIAVFVAWRPAEGGWGRRLALALAHAVLPAAMLVLLHGPTRVRVHHRDGRPPAFAILVDRSSSMAVEDAGASRYSNAWSLLAASEPKWAGAFQVQPWVFDRAARRAAPADRAATAPDGAMTDLAGAIDAVLADGTPPAGLLLVSDGIHNGIEDPLEAAGRARALRCPVYTMTLGSESRVRDLGIALSEAEGLTFVRQPYPVPVTLSSRGFRGLDATITARLGGRVVQQRRVRIEGDGDTSVEFSLAHDTPGVREYELGVEVQEGELFRGNNRQKLSLRVIDERIKILLLEGKPYWDSKFLLQALRRDANVHVTSLVRVAPDRTIVDAPGGEGAAALVPRDPERPLEDASLLAAYHVVILGKDADSFLGPAAVTALKDWVGRRGGHLVCARGRPLAKSTRDSELLGLLPLSWTAGEEQRFRMELTERGRMLTLFGSAGDEAAGPFRELPSLATGTRVEAERALAVVLARAQGELKDMAALTYQQYGAGRVVVLEGQGLWRWAFQHPAGPPGARRTFDLLWSNLVRWLIASNEALPSQASSLRPGKPAYSLDERPVLYIVQKDDRPGDLVVEVDREDAAPADGSFPIRVQATAVPGDASLRRAMLDLLPEGRYRARLFRTDPAGPALAEAAFLVTPPLQERLDVRPRPDLMRRIAELSDGGVIAPAELDGLVERYMNFAARSRPELEEREPAWDRAWAWILLMAWAALLWAWRRRWGLV